MVSISLGPLALPLNPLLMAGGWWLASWVADRLAGTQRVRAARALTMAAVIGLLASRAAFVALAWQAYQAEPLSMVNLRDGGWMPWAGLAAALGVLGGFAVRHAELRKPLAAGAAAGLAAWGALSWALGVHSAPSVPVPLLATLDGRERPLPLSDGKPTVVNLWASWCGPCRTEMPEFVRAEQQFPDVRFVYVNQGEPAPVVQRWLAQQPWTLSTVLLDPQQQLSRAAGSQGLPTTLFYDARGQLVERHFGPLSAASLAGRLQLLRP